jgi:hypothetical protein
MGRATRRLLTGLAAIVVVAFLLTVGVVAQLGDPRNESPEYWDAINDAQCFEHHLEDGFIPFGFRFANAYSQLPIGETVPITVQIRHITNYEGPHQVLDMTVTVNTEDAPNVQIVTDDIPDDIEMTDGPITMTHGDVQEWGPIFIGSGASAGHFRVQITDINVGGVPAPLDAAGMQGLLILQAGNRQIEVRDTEAEIPLGKDFFEAGGRGNYTFSAEYRSDNAMLPIEVTLEAELVVTFEPDATEVTFGEPTRPVLAAVGHMAEITIPVRITSEDEALIDFRIRANAFWEHQAGDGAPLDDGIYYRFLTMRVVGGDELIETAQQEAPTPVGGVVNLYNLLTRILGFIGLFLVVAAMFTGGVFGKSSRRWMNKMTGGAKKRVLWHSSVGFLIVLVASIHFGVALIETRNDISTGLLWGGLAWALMISLGFTGYYQVRMIKKWNYRVWRHMHLWSAVAVLVFVLFHLVLEGSSFSDIRRDFLPGYDRLLWPKV